MPWSPVSPPGSPPEEVPGEVLVSEKADKEDPGGEERLPLSGCLALGLWRRLMEEVCR